jgi:tetratricopeptide (TPR) repeat protein
MKSTNYLFQAIGLALLLGLFSCKNNSPEGQPAKGEASTTQASTPAIEELTQKIKSTPNSAQLYASRGVLWYEHENFDQGIADLEQAIQLDSTKPEYFHTLADFYMDYYKSKMALNTMQRAAANFPNRIPTLLKLSEYQLILQLYNDALFTLERIRAQEPLNADMFYMFGRVFTEMDKKDQAIAAFQSAVESNPDLQDAWVLLADLLAEKGNPIAAKYYENALRLDSNNIDALHAKAYYLSNRKNDLQGAIAIYKKINTIDPQYADGYYNTGLIYLDMDSVEQAYKNFDLAIKMAPTFADAYYHRGLAAEMKGNAQQAIADYENVLNFDPEFEGAKAGLKRLKK